MGFIEKFLNAIKLNDDFDEEDDYLDDEDEDDADDLDEDDLYDSPKPRKRFFSKFSASDDDYDDEDDDDDFDDEPVKPARVSRSSKSTEKKTSSLSSKRKSSSSSVSGIRSDRGTESSFGRTSSKSSSSWSADPVKSSRKVTPIRRKNSGNSMEVSVIRPSSMEDTREIADTLMNNCTVILNLEGLDVDIAQRVIDFSCGVCYSLEGRLQKVASYIFILTPADVDISGDFQSILTGAFDLSSMQSTY